MNEAIVKTPLDLRNQDSGKIDSNEGIYEKNNVCVDCRHGYELECRRAEAAD